MKSIILRIQKMRDLAHAKLLAREVRYLDDQILIGKDRIEQLQSERDLIVYRYGMARIKILQRWGDKAVFTAAILSAFHWEYLA